MYYVVLGYSDLGEGLRQVGEQVVDMFRADGGRIVACVMPCSASSVSLSWEWVVLAGWMTSDLTSATLAKKREYLQAVDEAERFFTSSLDFEGEDGTGSFRGKYVSYSLWSGVSGQCRMVDFLLP